MINRQKKSGFFFKITDDVSQFFFPVRRVFSVKHCLILLLENYFRNKNSCPDSGTFFDALNIYIYRWAFFLNFKNGIEKTETAAELNYL